MVERAEVRRGSGMWRFRTFLPLRHDEQPITLGEGDTPLLEIPRVASALNLGEVLLKDESRNPAASFKSRGMSAAVTRAVAAGARCLTIPTAGNAGVAAAAYGARAGIDVHVFAPGWTPARIVSETRRFGASVTLLDGHIGECGKAARARADETGGFDLSTLREPYRIEGKKTMALEIAMQCNWTLPDAVVYPTGGGTGLIGMWKGFNELLDAGWVTGTLPRMYSIQAEGCAPVVSAFLAGREDTLAWPDPLTSAAGLRVPAPLGGALVLQALRESGGGAVAVSETSLLDMAGFVQKQEGVDCGPEGAAALAGVLALRDAGLLTPGERVVVTNTGAGWPYLDP